MDILIIQEDMFLDLREIEKSKKSEIVFTDLYQRKIRLPIKDLVELYKKEQRREDANRVRRKK